MRVRWAVGLGLCCAVLAARPLAAQTGTSGMPELQAAIARTAGAIRALCPSADSSDRGALLREELRRADRAATSREVADWHALGCTRALLYVAEAISRPGLLMAVGTSWHEGAVAVLLRGLELRADHEASAALLAELALAEAIGPEPREVAAGLVGAVKAGVRGSMALRGCSEFARRTGALAESASCTALALEAGLDSVWQLINASRLAVAAGDTGTAQRRFGMAAAAARDSSDWATLGWHLRWFLEPAEEVEWRVLPGSQRPPWIRDRFAARDVRDGRAPGSRLAEHFTRLDTVEARFTVLLTRRQMGRFDHAATPEARPFRGAGSVRNVEAWYEPGLIAAQPYREFHRWEPRFDDRAVIWMRFGAPLHRVRWSGRDTARVLGCAQCAKVQVDAEGTTNTREAWQYVIDGRALLLSFESEQFSGVVEATRLVAGVLGSYFCGVDAARCDATNRSQLAFSRNWEMVRDSRDPILSALPPETVARIRQEDHAQVREATQQDDNAVRVEHPIAVVAQLARVWDPSSGAMLAVVPYAVRVGDVLRDEDSTGITATMAVTLRQWDPGSAEWQSTGFVRRLRLPDRLRNSSHLTGYLVTPSTPGTGAWSLVVAQGDAHRGRAWADRLPSLGGGALRLSDLVLGATSQDQSWTTTRGTVVPLGPLGAFDKNEPVSLYWQVQSESTQEQAQVTIALHEVGARGDTRPALEVTFEGRIGAGLTEWQRDLGVGRLDGGAYRVEVIVEAGGATTRRSGRLLLR